ncbi:damage-inducible protein DinB [Brevibacillus fluminis]|uniref:Damage-inducible protein DinB n=2 Tax=Brevibacillus fluminis TaxID=511487 RepID=A0A3M8CUP7_9BACL|nr:damage-inducible protein DinB [Brevibacillus fluminis]
MYDFHIWANLTMLNYLQELPAGMYEQELTSVFPTISSVMPHIYVTDRCWLEIMNGTNMSEALEHSNQIKEEIAKAGIADLKELFSQSAEKYREFFATHENMDAAIVVDNPYAGVRENSYAQIVLQVVNHATYHRGNITAMLRQLGHPSTMTEYALYWYTK